MIQIQARFADTILDEGFCKYRIQILPRSADTILDEGFCKYIGFKSKLDPHTLY